MPSKRAGSSVVGEILTTRAASLSPSRPLHDAALVWRSQSLPLSALIDSGGDESFIDRNVAMQMGIETEPLDSLLEAKALNSLLLARVDQKTVPVTLLLSGYAWLSLA